MFEAFATKVREPRERRVGRKEESSVLEQLTGFDIPQS